MKAAILPLLLLLALSVPATPTTTPVPTNARAAPGPLMGAGLLPVLLVGGGIYWLVRRKKTTSS
jgi:LPXTG-motif cell wall-anchored protein